MPDTATDTAATTFPIPLLDKFTPLPLDPAAGNLTDEQRDTLAANIQLCRDTLVFFTGVADARGVGGHTGGPYDIVPEVLIADGFMRHAADRPDTPHKVYPAYFDEAGHRVAIQYLMSVLNGHLAPEHLLHYREYLSHLPGHPELGFTPGITFSSGRLGHLWPFCNGVAMAHPDHAVIVFGSDGSQQEGNDAEAARLAVAQHLNIKVVVDDNNVTIAGHPSAYLPGFDVEKTLAGHGMKTLAGDGEDLDALFARMCEAVTTPGPVGVVNRRVMAEGIPGHEGTPHGHDVVAQKNAIKYLEDRGGYGDAVAYLKGVSKGEKQPTLPGSDFGDVQKNRSLFGEVVTEILSEMPPEERRRRVRVFDNDLEGSTGIKAIGDAYPEVYVKAGIMERGNLSAAAGFSYGGPEGTGRQGVYATFSAFLEMSISEQSMARLNRANVLCHFSHAGVDDMADNTCHFGINNLFGDGGLPGSADSLAFQPNMPGDPNARLSGGHEHPDDTRLYFPADAGQLRAVVRRVFHDPGLRFIFSNRSGVPQILDADGNRQYGDGYTFEPGKDELIREGSAGYVVSFGSTLYRALGAVERLREDGLDVGLVNKPTLNTCDTAMLDRLGSTGFVLLAEEFNVATGVGARFGTWLLERGHTPKYAHLGTWREGSGGLWRQMGWQGLDAEGIADAVKRLAS